MALRTTEEQTKLLAGVIAHLSRYLETGCPRAAGRAELLLHHLDAAAMDPELVRSCEALDRALSQSPSPGRAGAPSSASSGLRPTASRSSGAGVSFPN